MIKYREFVILININKKSIGSLVFDFNCFDNQ